MTGISIRTINADGQAKTAIEKLWKQFEVKKVKEQLLHKINDDIYCVYTNYESDENGYYTVILGFKTEKDFHSKEFTTVEIPEGIFEVYPAKGQLPDAILNTWQSIWKNSKNRTFKSDFDVYYADARNDEVAAETYLSVED